MDSGNSRHAFPKMQKMPDESLMDCHHVLAFRMVSCTVRGLQEARQGTEGDWQLSTGSKARRSANALINSRPCQPTLCLLNRGQAVVDVNRGAKIMLRWTWATKFWGHSRPLPCFLHFPTYFLLPLSTFSSIFQLWNPQTCTPLRDQRYTVSNLIYSLWKGLHHKQQLHTWDIIPAQGPLPSQRHGEPPPA